MALTATREDYLRAIFHLEEKIQGPIKAVALTHYLGLAKSTVSERLSALSKEKLVKDTYYGSVEFTSKGRTLAKKLTYKHRLIEVFLHDFLKMKKHEIHEEAHRLEHAFSDKAIEQLRKVLGNPSTDPHGKAINPT